MSVRLTIFLFVVLIILCLLAIYLDKEGIYFGEKARSEFIDFLEPEDVQAIELERRGEIIKLSRRDGWWWLIEPISDAANEELVERLISALQTIRIFDRLVGKDVEGKVGEYGLDKASVIIRVWGVKKNWFIMFGKQGIGQGRVFVQVMGRKDILLVGDEVLQLAHLPLEAYRDQRLARITPEIVDEIRIVRKDEDIRLQRRGSDWDFLRPLRARADREQVNELLERFLGARVLKLGPAATNSDEWFSEVLLVSFSTDEPLSISIGEYQQTQLVKVWNKNRNLVGFVHEETLELLKVSVDQLRAKDLLGFLPDLVDRIKIRKNPSSWEFERTEKGWQLISDKQNKNDTLNTDLFNKLFEI
ncbi:MAG: DUF4340 domain-containing protein, partial [Chthoniobacterales bacterium]|nr:DUF4340 domain-containing protein [Chthoniobacterales bacterium]